MGRRRTSTSCAHRLSPGSPTTRSRELSPTATEVPFEPGDELFREGEHADAGGCCSTGRSTWSAGRPRGHRGRPDGRTRPLGRWLPGLGRQRHLPRHRSRGRQPGRVFRLPRRGLRELVSRWFPFGGHLIRGLHHTARSIESTVRQRECVGHARHAGRRTGPRDQQPGGRGEPRGRRARQAATALLDALTRLARDASRPPSSPPSTSCVARRPQARRLTRSHSPTARATSPAGWNDTGGRPRGGSQRRWPPAGSTRLVRARPGGAR